MIRTKIESKPLRPLFPGERRLDTHTDLVDHILEPRPRHVEILGGGHPPPRPPADIILDQILVKDLGHDPGILFQSQPVSLSIGKTRGEKLRIKTVGLVQETVEYALVHPHNEFLEGLIDIAVRRPVMELGRSVTKELDTQKMEVIENFEAAFFTRKS